MGEGISEVATFAIGVAISPVPIIAVILMLFSARARVNGPVFLIGWMTALALVSGVVFVISDISGADSSGTASDTIAWGKVVLGLLLLVLGVRQWRGRPEPGTDPPMPGWMEGIDALTPVKALGLGALLAGVNPKNLILAVGAATGLAQLGLPTSDAVVSLAVFVIVGSLTIAGPVGYYLLGGESAKARLTELKAWLGVHNAAVMTVLFLVLGVDLVAKGVAPLTS